MTHAGMTPLKLIVLYIASYIKNYIATYCSRLRQQSMLHRVIATYSYIHTYIHACM